MYAVIVEFRIWGKVKNHLTCLIWTKFYATFQLIKRVRSFLELGTEFRPPLSDFGRYHEKQDTV